MDLLEIIEYSIPILATVLVAIGSTFVNYINKRNLRKQEELAYNIINDINDISKEVEEESQIIANKMMLRIEGGQAFDEAIKKISKEMSNSILNGNTYNNKIKKNADFDAKIEELIKNHHEQAIRQSVIQFWFSLIASIVGFIFIIAIIILSDNIEWYEYIVKLIPGIIIEAVSALFFSQAKATREQASDFLNKLREDRQYAKSIDIINSINDEKLKSMVKAEIALNLCKINNSDKIIDIIKNDS